MPQVLVVIEGDLVDVPWLVTEAAKRKVKVEVMTSVFGYTEEGARELFNRLAAPQQRLLSEVVLRGGHLPAIEMREAEVKDGRRRAKKGATASLRGLTGPIKRHVNKLVAEGVLGAGAKSPIFTSYAGGSTAHEFWMVPELVELFKKALFV